MAYDCQVPVTWTGNHRMVDTIHRDCRFGKVVEQVVQKNLDGQHWQERQKQDAARHGEHVAQIRARAHHHVFEDVGEGAPSFPHSLGKYAQVLAQKDHAGGFLRHIDGGIDRKTNISRMQWRRVVDAIANIADGVTRQKNDVASTRARSASSVKVAMSAPVSTTTLSKPRSRQTCRVTCSLSPLMTLTAIPSPAGS